MQTAVRPEAPSSDPGAIRNYIYDGGYWNDNAPVFYYHDDALGLVIQNKLLPDFWMIDTETASACHSCFSFMLTRWTGTALHVQFKDDAGQSG